MKENMNGEEQLACYLLSRYEELTGVRLESLTFFDIPPAKFKFEKLMYFMQKYSYAFGNKPMFEQDFIYNPCGPLLKDICWHSVFDNRRKSDIVLTDEEKYIIDCVIEEYGCFELWKLDDILIPEMNRLYMMYEDSEDYPGIIPKDFIAESAKNVRLYDHMFDMYVDEFEDVKDDSKEETKDKTKKSVKNKSKK